MYDLDICAGTGTKTKVKPFSPQKNKVKLGTLSMSYQHSDKLHN